MQAENRPFSLVRPNQNVCLSFILIEVQLCGHSIYRKRGQVLSGDILEPIAMLNDPQKGVMHRVLAVAGPGRKFGLPARCFDAAGLLLHGLRHEAAHGLRRLVPRP